MNPEGDEEVEVEVGMEGDGREDVKCDGRITQLTVFSIHTPVKLAISIFLNFGSRITKNGS